MIYLASPYSHPDAAVREARFIAASNYVVAAGGFVYSPIVYWHPQAILYDLPKDAAYWEDINRQTFASVTELRILDIDGWMRSVGVGMEIKWAKDKEIPIYLTGIGVDGTWTKLYSTLIHSA